MTALGGRLQQAQQEAAGWRAAHATTERHLVAAQDAVTEEAEAEAAARAMSAEEMSRITEQIEHRARITKGRQQRMRPRRFIERGRRRIDWRASRGCRCGCRGIIGQSMARRRDMRIGRAARRCQGGRARGRRRCRRDVKGGVESSFRSFVK